jgi:hypothetical protein
VISAADETVYGAGASVNPSTLAPIVIYENGQHQGRVSVRLPLTPSELPSATVEPGR